MDFRTLLSRTAPAALPATGLLLSGCGLRGSHHALDPAGPQAGAIGSLWWLLLVVSAVVFVVVMTALVLALTRYHETPDRENLPAQAHRTVMGWVAGGVGVTVLILFVFLVATLLAERRIAAIDADPEALEISVIGRQWWWEIQYENAAPWLTATTANEIHIPVGRPVHLKLNSADVIHSFWVPSLGGKRDLIPGHTNRLSIQADRAGVFEGQCAEFCGHQHAHMRIIVVAQPPEEFEAWLEQQRQPAREPQTEGEIRGREVFLASDCIMCHSIRGTTAMSQVGPDLTHLAGRRTLAAGVLPNTRGHLGGWILDPQGIKPGNRMPRHTFPAEQFHPLLDYLGSLE